MVKGDQRSRRMFQIPVLVLVLLPGVAAHRPFRCTASANVNQTTANVTCIDWSKVGRAFEGLGALSGGGGTSRLLYDYEDP